MNNLFLGTPQKYLSLWFIGELSLVWEGNPRGLRDTVSSIVFEQQPFYRSSHVVKIGVFFITSTFFVMNTIPLNIRNI